MNERDELVNDIREWANTTGGPSPDAPQIDVLALVIRDAGLDMTRLDDDRKAFVRAYRRGADEPELDDLAYELRVYGDKLIDQVLNASTAQVHKYYAHRKLSERVPEKVRRERHEAGDGFTRRSGIIRGVPTRHRPVVEAAAFSANSSTPLASVPRAREARARG